ALDARAAAAIHAGAASLADVLAGVERVVRVLALPTTLLATHIERGVRGVAGGRRVVDRGDPELLAVRADEAVAVVAARDEDEPEVAARAERREDGVEALVIAARRRELLEAAAVGADDPEVAVRRRSRARRGPPEGDILGPRGEAR